jgi:hypothetical protein
VTRAAILRAATLAAIFTMAWAPGVAATPPPSGSPHPAPVATPHLPNIPLHTEVIVEVNKMGQVVRVKSTKPCKVPTFNVQTFGNALQMWIRHPDGSAQVGLYRVTYDYDPKTQKVTRQVYLISAGGSWANDEGAANAMIDTAKKEAAEARAAQQHQSPLPSLNEIRGFSPSPHPTPAATLPP